MKSINLLILLIFTLQLLSNTTKNEKPIVNSREISESIKKIVYLKEIFKIEDQNAGFFLKRPHSLKIAPDESLFILDENQFLKFNKDGSFIKNLQKPGEGPGEYNYLWNYYIKGNLIYLFAGPPARIIVTDLSGKLLREKRIDAKHDFRRAIGFENGYYWGFTKSPKPQSTKKTGITDIEMNLSCLNFDGDFKITDITISEKWFSIEKRIGNSIQTMGSILVPIESILNENGQLYVTNTSKYLIKRIDLSNKKQYTLFSRKYKQIPFRKKENESKKPNILRIPDPDYFNDILKIFFSDGNLWILTSKLIEGKGILVDIISPEGKLLDQFYLSIPWIKHPYDLLHLPIAISDGNLIAVKRDIDDNFMIVKYKIINYKN